MHMTPFELQAYAQGSEERWRRDARLFMELKATMVNLWSSTKTSAAQLMGEEEAVQIEDGGSIREQAARLRREREAREDEEWDRELVASDDRWATVLDAFNDEDGA